MDGIDTIESLRYRVREANERSRDTQGPIPFINPNLEQLFPWFKIGDKDAPCNEKGTRGQNNYQIQLRNPITGVMGNWCSPLNQLRCNSNSKGCYIKYEWDDTLKKWTWQGKEDVDSFASISRAAMSERKELDYFDKQPRSKHRKLLNYIQNTAEYIEINKLEKEGDYKIFNLKTPLQIAHFENTNLRESYFHLMDSADQVGR
jgi:hypothetical protein